MSNPVYNQNEMFSSRATVEEAVIYSQELINTLPLEHRMAATTALWVSLNTVLAKLEKLNPHNVRPIPLDELPKEIKIKAIPQEQLAIMIRTLIAPSLSQLHRLSLLPVIGDLVEGPTSFTALVSQYFGVSPDELVDEIKAYRAS